MSVDLDSVLEALDNMTPVDPQNRDFYDDNFEDLWEKYPGETVAILDGEVVETSGDFEDGGEMVRHMKEEYGEEEFDKAYIRHVPDPDITYIPG